MKALVLACALLAACHDHDGAPASSTDLDVLWKLEPAHAVVGIVVSPAGVVMIEHAWQDVLKTARAVPELAPVAEAMSGVATELGGTADMSLATFGWGPATGFAVFFTADEPIVILPVIDRNEFIAHAHGTRGDTTDKIGPMVCKPIRNVYACGATEPLIDSLGTGDGHLRKLIDARGDIEIAGSHFPDQDPRLAIAFVAHLTRGAITLRGTIDGVPANITALVPKPMKPRFESDSTGFALATAATRLSELLATLPSAPSGLLADPITATTHATPAIVDVRVPVTDPAAAQKQLDGCATFSAIGLSSDATGCHFALPDGAKADVWLDGRTLRVGDKLGAKGQTIALTELGKELASGSWNLALWGRGSLFGASTHPLASELSSPVGNMMYRAISMLSEFGIAGRLEGNKATVVVSVRTAWSNPDDVVAKLAAIPIADLLKDTAAPAAQQIADSARSSPFAADLKAGPTGLMLPMMMIGAITSIAIPAFDEYMQRGAAPR